MGEKTCSRTMRERFLLLARRCTNASRRLSKTIVFYAGGSDIRNRNPKRP